LVYSSKYGKIDSRGEGQKATETKLALNKKEKSIIRELNSRFVALPADEKELLNLVEGKVSCSFSDVLKAIKKGIEEGYLREDISIYGRRVYSFTDKVNRLYRKKKV